MYRHNTQLKFFLSIKQLFSFNVKWVVTESYRAFFGKIDFFRSGVFLWKSLLKITVPKSCFHNNSMKTFNKIINYKPSFNCLKRFDLLVNDISISFGAYKTADFFIIFLHKKYISMNYFLIICYCKLFIPFTVIKFTLLQIFIEIRE